MKLCLLHRDKTRWLYEGNWSTWCWSCICPLTSSRSLAACRKANHEHEFSYNTLKSDIAPPGCEESFAGSDCSTGRPACWLLVPAPRWGNQTCLELMCVQKEGRASALCKQQGKSLPRCTGGMSTSSHSISLLRAQRLNVSIIWGGGIPKLSNTGRLHGSPVLPAIKCMNNSCKRFSFCYSVKAEYWASDSCSCNSVCEYSLSSALPSDCFHPGATALNMVGFWDAVQVKTYI